METGTEYQLKERLIATLKIKNVKEAENVIMFGHAARKEQRERSHMEGKGINQKKAK